MTLKTKLILAALAALAAATIGCGGGSPTGPGGLTTLNGDAIGGKSAASDVTPTSTATVTPVPTPTAGGTVTATPVGATATPTDPGTPTSTPAPTAVPVSLTSCRAFVGAEGKTSITWDYAWTASGPTGVTVTVTLDDGFSCSDSRQGIVKGDGTSYYSSGCATGGLPPFNPDGSGGRSATYSFQADDGSTCTATATGSTSS